MHTVIVNLQVKPDMVEAFLEAIGETSRASRRDEPGCLRFDVHRDNNDPNHFVLYELYADERAFTEDHRSTPHYEKWRAASATAWARSCSCTAWPRPWRSRTRHR